MQQPEIRMGEAPGQIVLVESERDVETLQLADPTRVSYVAQTTLAVDETNAVVTALRSRFPDARGPGSEDICYATTNRQLALTAIAEEADVVLVVGSANSSNSRRLAELSIRRGTPAHLIEDAGEIDPEWLRDARVVGLTAGASAPPELVDEVVELLRALGPVEVRERQVTQETVRFGPPSTPRRPTDG